MKIKTPSHATVVAYAALFFALGGTAAAATGNTFITGRSNTATSQTYLVNRGAGPVLALGTQNGQVPLAVSATAGKATNLNADRIDGLDGTALQRRVTGSCAAGSTVTGVQATGTVTCQPVPSGPQGPAGPAGRQAEPTTLGSLVPFGDSIIFNAGSWARRLCDRSAVVFCPTIAGHPGQDTAGLLPFVASEVVPLHPEHVTITAGANDLYSEVTVEQTVANLRRICQDLRAAGIKPVLSTITPVNDRAAEVGPLNVAIRELARADAVPLLDVYGSVGTDEGTYRAGLTDDGVHPNAAGYDALLAAVDQQIGPAFRS